MTGRAEPARPGPFQDTDPLGGCGSPDSAARAAGRLVVGHLAGSEQGEFEDEQVTRRPPRAVT
ncbi:hypothetical protein [Actinomadura alba]|uniref:Uncharacterized protein n=1 Tax=Actinomadura alba TaxID=406431 RepID=A0ABR7LMI0_9ACTN|nr:hypothetical protein [Actinomadura alba]MBC6465971.1 hypothetical protein [Actinomadura alba]